MLLPLTLPDIVQTGSHCLAASENVLSMVYLPSIHATSVVVSVQAKIPKSRHQDLKVGVTALTVSPSERITFGCRLYDLKLYKTRGLHFQRAKCVQLHTQQDFPKVRINTATQLHILLSQQGKEFITVLG